MIAAATTLLRGGATNSTPACCTIGTTSGVHKPLRVAPAVNARPSTPNRRLVKKVNANSTTSKINKTMATFMLFIVLMSYRLQMSPLKKAGYYFVRLNQLETPTQTALLSSA